MLFLRSTHAGESGPAVRRARVATMAAILAAILAGCSGSSAPPPVDIDNSAPLADAGGNQTVLTGTDVLIDGTGSSDPDGDALDFDWELLSRPAGSSASLAVVAGQDGQRRLVPDRIGDYVVRMDVSDIGNLSDTDTVTITADPPPPFADAGLDFSAQFTAPSTAVNFDGTGSSDVSGLPLTYAWTIVSFTPAGAPPATNVTLANASTATPGFTVTDPDQLGVYTLQLTVDNGYDTGTDQVVVTVGSIPPPVADAGADQQVTFVVDGVTVNLDGSASSDPSSLPLSYSWEILSFAPAGDDPPAVPVTLVNATSATPSFDVTAIDQLGTYTLQLTVSNGTLNSADTVVVEVAKTFPAAGAMLGTGLLAAAAFALRGLRRRASRRGA